MSEPVVNVEANDPAMAKASENARATFKHFWRELYWERRRTVPALGIAMIKLAFSDEDKAVPEGEDPQVEHMWINDIECDGTEVTGILINSPNWLKSVREGDHVRAPLNRIGDWIYTVDNRAYGAHTVNLMRSRMGKQERRSHDSAWGLDFGDPHHIKVVYDSDSVKPKGFFSRLFKKDQEEQPTDRASLGFKDHPACINLIKDIEQQVKSNPSALKAVDEDGWTGLHHEALAGNLAIVKILLRYGSDPNALTKDGLKASDLAAAIGWKPISEFLKTHES